MTIAGRRVPHAAATREKPDIIVVEGEAVQHAGVVAPEDLPAITALPFPIADRGYGRPVPHPRAAKAFHFGDGHTGNAESGPRGAHILEPKRFDKGGVTAAQRHKFGNVDFEGRTKRFVSLFQVGREHIFDPFHECADSARQVAPMRYYQGHVERLVPKI